jgi:peptidyl-prolyl cis-trans isomerase SurA
MKFLFSLFLVPFLFIQTISAQSGQVADRIIAVVNDRIILKSEIDNQVSDYIRSAQSQNQSIPFSEALWYEVLESVIDEYVLLEKAKIDSITVSDDLVNREMNNRLMQLQQQLGSEQAVEEAFGRSMVQLRADFRDEFRDQMITNQVRLSKIQSVSITRPEVIEFFNKIPQDSLPTIPEQVSLSQIVVIPPPLADANENARKKAEAIRDSILNHDKSFEEMARLYSTGPAARNGGLLPMIQLGDLVAEYSAAASALEPGQISQVVRTAFGYHVIRLNRRVGDSIETNNIVIAIDENSLDEQFAIQKLEALRDSVINHGVRFSDLARRHSEDPITAPTGGRLIDPQTQQRLIPINRLDPALYRITLLLESIDDISEPRPFNTGGQLNNRAFRIVKLDNSVPEHVANIEQDFDRIESIALEQKRLNALENWMREIRNEIYVEYKISIPEEFRQS